jgi:hypothetical protein
MGLFKRSVASDGPQIDGMVSTDTERPQPRKVREKTEVFEGAEAIERFAQTGLRMLRENRIVDQLQRCVRHVEFPPELNELQFGLSTDPLSICTVEFSVDVQDTTTQQHPCATVVGEGAPKLGVPKQKLIYRFGSHAVSLGKGSTIKRRNSEYLSAPIGRSCGDLQRAWMGRITVNARFADKVGSWRITSTPGLIGMAAIEG